MGRQEAEKVKKHICIGLLAHVDAGKTTLSESILYRTGAIRTLGRVDKQTAFLDTDKIERSRGITVFSKEARFHVQDTAFTLLDTPGHVDFSMETERTLQVLDFAILVVSGAEGVQGHTITLCSLLASYNIPTFIFVNKMDQPGADREKIMAELAENFGDGFIDMEKAEAAEKETADKETARKEATEKGTSEKETGGKGAANKEEQYLYSEELALCSESLMEEFLADGCMKLQTVREAIARRQVFPVYFGSALKLEGIDEFLKGLAKYTKAPDYPEQFGARVYKITRDKQGARETHMKITGGTLRSKMLLTDCGPEEKVDQIRIYSGTGFQSVQEAVSGTVCAVTGLSRSFAGEGLGYEAEQNTPALEPTMSYRLILPQEADPTVVIRQLRLLEEEEPSLRVTWSRQTREIHVNVMGELALEILQHIISERFGIPVSFGEGTPVYKETISEPVIGIGHFEPLRHYAEVHLLMEPGPRGSGLVFDTICSEDKLDRNWQRLILTHLAERPHPGVLIGADITDMKITLIAGRAHIKHTDGGDFRQATYRAVRQGLRKAQSILLEPVSAFKLEIPQENLGRALADMQRIGATADIQEQVPEAVSSASARMSVVTGEGPARALQGYQRDVASYTRGMGRFTTVPCGYRPCADQESIVESAGYQPESDTENPTGSIFCEHGAAVYVDWKQVDGMAHVDSGFRPDGTRRSDTAVAGPAGYRDGTASGLGAAGEKELEEIFLRTYGKSKRDEALRRERMSQGSRRGLRQPETVTLPPLKRKDEKKGDHFLIVDGYNVVFAWDELAALAKVNIDAAREALLETLENYQGYKKIKIIVVFDGYKVQGNTGTKHEYAGVQAIYTKEAETADRFIEKTVYEMGKSFDITVVTSDRLVQMAALGDGARRMSSREFYQEVTSVSEEIREKLKRQTVLKNRPFEGKL